MFPASKATTLESNKSLARPHPSTLSTATGNAEPHSRHRRSVDGHASVPPLNSSTPSTVDTMHDITPSLNVSLPHGVELASEAITNEGLNVSVSSDVNVSNTGDITTLKPSSQKEASSTSQVDDLTKVESSSSKETTVEQTTITSTSSTTDRANLIITTSTSKQTPKHIEEVKVDKTLNKRRVEQPLEILTNKPYVVTEKDNIAYDPEDMQSDVFPSIYSYGVQKLQYIKLLTRLKQANEDLHINLEESNEADNNLDKFRYDSVKSTSKAQTIAPSFMITEPITTTETTITAQPTEKVTSTTFFATTNKFAAQTEHEVTPTLSPIVTNNNLVENASTKHTDGTTVVTTEAITVNTGETKVSDAPNHKHVLINLTISSDDAENSSYKPIYSLTLTVPTIGDSNEIPTVKITPMEAEPTQPSNFNKPVTLEGTAKVNKATNTEDDWGGSCECSCPSCENNSADNFYDDYGDNNTNTKTTEPSSTYVVSTETDSTETSDMSSTESVTAESITSTTDAVSTTDSTTENDTEAPTTELQCICPKVEPPPILILEGEVVELQYDQS